LVLLPVLLLGQNIQAKASDKRAEDTYKDADATFHTALQIQEHLEAQDSHIEAQEKCLAELTTTMAGIVQPLAAIQVTAAKSVPKVGGL
jgi:hypothetical protein